jgi:hypothetical protein
MSRSTKIRRLSRSPQQLIYQKGDLVLIEVTEEMSKKYPVLEPYVESREHFEVRVVWRANPQLTVRWCRLSMVEMTIKNYQVIRISNRLSKEV